MTAAEIYQFLDRHGLTPPVHYIAAPHEWKTCLEALAEVWGEQRRKDLIGLELMIHEAIAEAVQEGL